MNERKALMQVTIRIKQMAGLFLKMDAKDFPKLTGSSAGLIFSLQPRPQISRHPATQQPTRNATVLRPVSYTHLDVYKRQDSEYEIVMAWHKDNKSSVLHQFIDHMEKIFADGPFERLSLKDYK